MIVSFTQKKLKTLSCPINKSKVEYCCAEFPGLLLEVRSGKSSPTWQYRYKAAGKTKYQRIGSLESHTLIEAKQVAVQLKAEIQNGRDPREEAKKIREVPTLREFVEKEYTPHIKSRLRSWKDNQSRLNCRVLPVFGDQPMNTITRKQLADFHLSLQQEGLAGASSDHHIKLVRRIFNLAIEWGVVKDNPAAKALLFNEPNQVENTLNEEELKRLLLVLHTHKRQTVCRLARLLLGTGARLSEGLHAKFSDFDIENRTWRISAAVSKSKKVRSVPLNDFALAVLDEIQTDSEQKDGFLFMNPRSGERLKTVSKAWGEIRNAAGLPHFRAHDLRHQLASELINAGRTLYEVQQVLGHSSPQVTQRYAHLTTATLQAAANSASDRIQAASPKPTPPELKLITTCS